jgi:anti-sigma factor RsiW
MTDWTESSDDLILQAYCDGELDPVTALAFERRMAGDAPLRARYDALMSLRRALRVLPQDEVPPDLLARIESTVESSPRRQRSWSWQALAASALIGAVLAGSITMSMNRYEARQQIVQQLVSSHIRSLLAPQPFDIASSDRHTVKPWFSTHVPESPQVVDLASQGFPLAGGRVDVIGRDPVATMVYKHAAHVISVIALPPSQQVPSDAIAGYNVRSWRDGDFTYVAISDITGDDLAAFERAFVAGLSR